MAKLMEQGDDFVVRKQGRFITDRGREVTGQVGDRQLNAVGGFAARNAFVHPGAATFAMARVQVDIEIGNWLALLVADLVKAGIFMPQRGISFAYLYAKNGFHHFKQASQHFVFGKVLFHFLVRESIFFFAQFFADKRHIPGLHIAKTKFFGIGF